MTAWTVVAALAAAGLFAQTPVGEAIDTPRVRAIVITEQPHRPTPLHEHKLNRVQIYLADGQMTVTSPDGKVNQVQFKKGEARWSPPSGPHVSENITDRPVQIAEIELKGKPQSPPAVLSKLDPLKVDPQHYSLEFENEQVRVMRVRFGPREKGLEHEHTYANVVVYLNDQARGKAGEMRMDGPRTHSEENPLDHAVERLSIDLK